MRILVVVEQPDVASLICQELSAAGHEVRLVAGAQPPLASGLAIDYDAAVFEHALPGLDGLQLLRGLRQQGQDIPVLMLAAHPPSAESLAGPDAACDFLYQPFTLVELVSRLQMLLQRAPTRMEEEVHLRRSREQLRELSAHLFSLREEESARISRTIHDDLGQALTGLKMDLAWLQRHLGQDPEALRSKMQAMAGLIDSTIETVRRIATELRPGILDDLGLLPAIEWQLQEFQKRTGITCVLRSSPQEMAPADPAATVLFRIFQEALTNVARHAQAGEVVVTLEETPDTLVLRLQDNGRGITEAEIRNPKSIGLVGMRERALLCGGEVQVHALPGRGTAVTVRLPRHLAQT